MRILLINIAHPAIGSRIPDDHLPPLGLLAIGGPLLDDGHEVQLLDLDIDPLPKEKIVEQAAKFNPDAVLFGHSGSTSGHPIIADVSRRIAAALPSAAIVYGGVYPTYHWREILASEPHVSAIVRGEGEETTRQLARALEAGNSLLGVPGLAIRHNGHSHATNDAPLIRNLDDYRIGWELIDHRRYSYWGGKRAVVAQFSRGCPHLCTYCGQRGFWARWRYRDPVKFARELARLHREQGIEVINFADENPTSSRRAWKAFLEALIEEDVDLLLVGSTRAGDIVRDKDILHLYRKAGCIRFLLGLENTDEKTIENIRKGSTTSIDREAIRLLRRHGIISMATWVVGFEEETDLDHWHGLKQLMSYDPDQIQLLYVTPHRWTPYYREAVNRRVIQTDKRRWDYKHQVLETRCMPPWRVLLWVKFTEAVLQARPKALYRTYLQPDRELRHAMRWYTSIGRRVWPYEVYRFLREKLIPAGPTVGELWGPPQDHEQLPMGVVPARYYGDTMPASLPAPGEIRGASMLSTEWVESMN